MPGCAWSESGRGERGPGIYGTGLQARRSPAARTLLDGEITKSCGTEAADQDGEAEGLGKLELERDEGERRSGVRGVNYLTCSRCHSQAIPRRPAIVVTRAAHVCL